MTDTSTIAGGRAPSNGNSYNPIVGPTHYPVGTPVCENASGRTIPALASSLDTATPTGVATVPGVPGQRSLTQFAGPMSLTVDEWTAVTGEVIGLTPGAVYFVSTATAGKLTKIPPTGDGNLSSQVGVAVSNTDLNVQLSASQPAG